MSLYPCGRPHRGIGATSIAAAVLGGALMLAGCSPSLESGQAFTEHELAVSTYGLFDLGVVDANGDGLLDVFTANHSGRQSLALNQGGLSFRDVFSEWGLEQDARFPGLNVVPEEAVPDAPGVYVSWRGPDIVVRGHGLPGRVSGTVEILSAVTVEDSEGFEVEVETEELPAGPTHSLIRFSGGSQGYFAFRPFIHALPITFRLDKGVDARQIFVGPGRVSPAASEFTMNMRDRHGMAWADYNGDGLMDLFITRGGLRGTMNTVPLRFWDELYVQGPDGMHDIAREVGLEKRGCPGRQAAWVDFDGDGRLDIYVACGRGEDRHPNQLFRQLADGHFENVAQALGLAMGPNGKFVWLDVDGDHDPDLVWAERHELAWYENRGEAFRRHRLMAYERRHDVSGLRLGDPDGDGDQDVLAVSGGGNVLILNEQGGLEVVDPGDWGLPGRSMAAAWVDVDNDGVEELYALPGGLYRRGEKGRYRRTGTLDLAQGPFSPWRLMDAHLTWADMDNDGSRDLVVAIGVLSKPSWWARWLVALSGQGGGGEGALKGHWVARIYANKGGAARWLQARLDGPRGNRQALGSRVRLRAGDLRHGAGPGGAEGSRYSQGHYRLYFGLGEHARAGRLEVQWPDGRVQDLHAVEADRLLTLRRHDAEGSRASNTNNREEGP